MEKNLGVILKSFGFFLISFYSRKISFEKYNLKKSGFFGINMSMNIHVAILQTLCIYICSYNQLDLQYTGNVTCFGG